MSKSVLSTRGSIVAQRPGGSTTPPRQYGRKRVCAYPGCKTILSRYNSSETCSVHQGMVKTKTDPTKLADVAGLPAEKRCSLCGKVYPVRSEPRVHFSLQVDPYGALRVSAYCRECSRAYARELRRKRIAKAQEEQALA